MLYELRTIKGCPHAGPALDLFRSVLAAEGLGTASLTVRELSTEDEAAELHFHGSPSFIAGGKDLFPVGVEPALSCRIYPGPDGVAGMPSSAALREAVRGIDPRT